MISRTASVSFSAIMGVDMDTNQGFANWFCGMTLLPEFLLRFFRSMSGEFGRLMMGTTHNTIYMPDIQAFCFAHPPVEERRAIVAYPSRNPSTRINLTIRPAEHLNGGIRMAARLCAVGRSAPLHYVVREGYASCVVNQGS